MSDVRRVPVGRLRIDADLHAFVEAEVLPGTGVQPAVLWAGLDRIVAELATRNRELLERRQELQRRIDAFHRDSGDRFDGGAYEQLLREIGYLVDQPPPFQISTADVDREIADVAGPQLVVPVTNARFAANAVNARWGSLYDALYGTDAVDGSGPPQPGAPYDPERGAKVIGRARELLDLHLPLDGLSHADVDAYTVDEGGLLATSGAAQHRLADASAFVGFQGERSAPPAIVLQHHGLHLMVEIDRQDSIGRSDRAGVKDVRLESAVTTIMDMEDSVASVDAADKIVGYRNWLQLMQGTLAPEVSKGGTTFTRAMHGDVELESASGEPIRLAGRSLMLVRHVGHLMTTDAVLDADGREIPEGILDALLASACALHDLRGPAASRNSRSGSIYVVKPKLHGPEEVAFTCELLSQVERILELAPQTIKLGLMDEERRTSANLRACIHAARDRVAFINTGFLDRTRDEIHTSKLAGPMVRKNEMKRQRWLETYEDANVDAGLACGFPGRAQIGKGMWAAPEAMAAMLAEKAGHPRAGANCAWVPSPTAATLHALHYHEVDVHGRQAELATRTRRPLRDLLTIPVQEDVEALDDEARASELDNNLQGILGYTVRWVDHGIGCSKVPGIAGTPLMEDRATVRISSQHVANWLLHGIVTDDEVERSLRRMAAVVDEQNAADPAYEPMAPSFDGAAFQAARELVMHGRDQPSGYTDVILQTARRRKKGTAR